MPIYKLSGKTYNIPDDVVEQFEQDNPDATQRYTSGNRKFDIPVRERQGFLETYPDAVIAEEIPTPASSPVSKEAASLQDRQPAKPYAGQTVNITDSTFSEAALDSIEKGATPVQTQSVPVQVPARPTPLLPEDDEQFSLTPFADRVKAYEEMAKSKEFNANYDMLQKAVGQGLYDPNTTWEQKEQLMKAAQEIENARKLNRSRYDEQHFNKFYDKSVAPIFGTTRQEGEERANTEAEAQPTFNSPNALMGNAFRSTLSYMKYTDPEKIAGETLRRVENDDAFGDYVMGRMGIDKDAESADGASVPQLSENEKDWIRYLYRQESEEVADMIVQRIYDQYQQENAPRSTLQYILGKAFHENLILSLTEALLRRASNSSGMREQLRAQAYEAYGRESNWAVRAAGGAAPFAVDMAAGGFALPNVVGGVVSKSLFRAGVAKASQQVVKKMAQRAAARGLEGAAIKEAVSGATGVAERYLATQAPIVNLALRSAGSAANFATYDMQSEIVRQIAAGEFKPFDLMKEAAHGAIVGAVMGGAGGTIAHAAKNAGTLGKIGAGIAGLGAETTIFGISNGLAKAQAEGIPISSVDWADTMGEAFGQVVGMKTVGALMHPRELLNRYRKSKAFDLQLNERDLNELKQAGYDFDGLFKGLGKFAEVAPMEVSKATEYLSGPEGTGKKRSATTEEAWVDADAYQTIMSNPEISSSTKRKLAYIATGKVLTPEPVFGVEMNVGDDGKVTLTTKNASGMPIETKDYKTEEDARKDFEELQGVSRINTIAGLERVAVKAGMPDVVDVAKARTFDEMNVEVDDALMGNDIAKEIVHNVLDRYIKNLQDVYMERFNSNLKRITGREDIVSGESTGEGAAGAGLVDGGATAGASASQSFEAGATTPTRPTPANRSAAYQRGMNVSESLAELPNINYEVMLADSRIATLFPDSDPQAARLRNEVMKAVEQGLYEEADRIINVSRSRLTTEQVNALEQYQNIVATQYGVEDGMVAAIKNYEEQQRATLELISTPDGTITPLFLKDGSTVYYKAGDLNNTYGGVMVSTPDGEQRQIPTSSIQSVEPSQKMDDVLATDVESYGGELRSRYNNLANGEDFLEGYPIDLAVSGQRFTGTFLGKDAAGNNMFGLEDGSQFSLSPAESRHAVEDANNMKIQAQLKQEAEATAGARLRERYEKGITGFAEGKPDYAAPDSDAKTVAEYLLSMTDGDKGRSGVLKNIDGEQQRIEQDQQQAYEEWQRAENAIEMSDDDPQKKAKAIQDRQAAVYRLNELEARRRKWGEIRQEVMTPEERVQYESARQKVYTNKLNAARKTSQPTPETTAIPTSQELLTNYEEQYDAERAVTDMRKNNTQQWREDVFPKLDNLRKAITDYQRGLTDYTEEELEQIAHDQIELEAQERILVENNKALKQLAQNLGRIYAARKNASLTPHERLMNRLAAEQDPQKKIQLAKQAFSDDPMALTVLENIEPLDVEEFVSDNLGYGTLNWEGLERGEHHVRGLQEMMGRDKTRGIGRNSDTNGFNAFLAPTGQGLGFDEVVHSIWEAQPDQMDGGKAYDTQDISNALLGMLQSATKPTDISNRIVNNRIAEAEEVYNENIERMREEEEEAMREEEQQREEEEKTDKKEEPDTFTGRLEQAKGETDTAPTEGQKQAGNYKMGHIEFGGYKMSIENPKGSVRSGVDANGRPWSITMQDTYGYIGKKFGADGDHLDFFINDDADLDTWNGRVFIVDQKNEDGTFDEHKVMYGYNTWADAARAYQRNYEAGWWDKHVMQMMGVRKADFDKWLDDSDHKRKPFADYFRTKMQSDVVSDPVSDLLSTVDERRERVEQQEQKPSWSQDELSSMDEERLQQLKKKRTRDLSVSRVMLKTTGVKPGSDKEQLLNKNIVSAERDIDVLNQEIERRQNEAAFGDIDFMISDVASEDIAESKKNTENRYGFGNNFVTLHSEEAKDAVEGQKATLTKTAPWREGVEDVTVHTTLSTVRKKYGELHEKAKAGDREAALELVKNIVKPEKIKALAEQHPNARVAFVHAEEATGRNAIPALYARQFEKQGLQLDDDIIQVNKPAHTGSDRVGRFICRARFDGEVESGAEYIIVDDHVTMGGTLRDLKDYIESKGGKVVAVSTLTASAGGTKLRPTEEQIQQLNEKGITNEQLRELGIADNIDGLTRHEAAEILVLADKGRERGFETRPQRDFGVGSGTRQIEDEQLLADKGRDRGFARGQEARPGQVQGILGRVLEEEQLASDSASEPSIIALPRIDDNGLNVNTPIGIKLSRLKKEAGEVGLVGYTDSETGDYIFLGNDAELIDHSINLKAKVTGMQDGMSMLRIPADSFDIVTPSMVRKGYKFAITDDKVDEADRLMAETQRRTDVADKKQADTTIKSYFDKQPQRTEEQRVRVRATKAVLTAMSNAKVPYKVVSPEEEKQMLRLFSLMNKEAVKEFARRPSMRAKDKHGRGRYIVYNMQDPFGVPMYAEKLEVARWIKQGAKRYGGDWEILDIGEAGKEQTDGALKNAADMQTMIVRLGNGDDAKTIQFMIGDEADAAEQPMFQKEGKRILGWSDGKQVYLTQAGLNPNTPLHECTHMWDKWCQQVQPELWKRLVNALKKTAAWEELRQNPNYRNIWNDENRMASEVHSRLTGATGEDEFMKAAFKQSTPKKIINEVKSVLRKFWEAVLRLFGKGRTISDDFDSLEAIVRMPIRDLVNEDFEKVMKVAEQDAVSSGDLALMDGEMLMKTLMGVHNISEEKLKKVIKQGGLANPSLAVFDTRNYTHTDYGEISLIPRSSMIDARTGKNAGTWTADAWTPTYPHTEKHMSDKGQDKFWSDLSKVENDEAVGGSDISSKLRLDFDSYLDGRDSAGMYWWYLYERGQKPEKVLFTTDKKQEDIDAYKAVMGDNDRYSDLDEAGQAKLLELVARDKGKTLEELHQDMQALKERNEKRAAAPGAKAFVKMNVKRINEEIDTYGVPYSYISDYVNAMNAAIRSAGKVNVAATFNQARKTVKEKNLESDFGKWLEDKEKQYGIDEVIFTGYTPEGDRKYVKNTLANASRVMKQEGRNGAHGMGGIGLMIATVAKRVTSLDQIRKEKKNLSSTPEQHEAFREKWDNVMFGIAQQCGDGDLWTGEARLQEALGTKNPVAHLKNEYGISLPQEDVRQLNTFIDEVRKNYPTGYFETKFERPVGLEEFAVAVVPEATSPEVVEALKNAGLDVRTYNATGSEEQKRESRRIAVMDAVGMRNDILFHIEDDTDTLERLDKEPTEKGYRNVVVNEDGTLGSPMANRLGRKGVGRKATTPFEFGKWERSDEHPELANENGKIDLIKPGNKEIGGVDYNPYIHIRPNKVNKQFKQAWERPNLIYVETEYPKSELEGGYHAEKAALSVGKHPWGGGELILSRWDKPVRMVPWEEVADDWEKEFAGRGVEFDIVPPALLPILAERGVEILPPHKGMGKACNEAYQAWKVKNAEQEKMYRHITPAEDEANKEYNRQLDKYAVGEMKSHEEFNLGEPSPILRICGVTGKEIHMNQSVLKSHLEKHSLTINELKNIPSALYHPIMVYQWGDKARSHVIISELPTHDGRKVTVTIRVNNTGHVLDVEKITSVHGKDLEHLVKEINTEKSDFGKDNLKYVDKKKALQWLAMDPPKGSRQTNEGLNSAAKIINDFDSTKYFEEKISELFPEYVSAASDASELIGGEKVRFEVVAPEEGTLGWYDPNDNSVHVVIPNHSNAEEVKRTVFHEKLGHEGLVSLLGSQEEVNKFGQYIFKSASKELRRKMLGKADDEGYGWDDPLRFSKAAQEVFADIAADGPKTVEEFSLWTKVKHYLIKGLKKLGVSVRGLLNDHDLSYYVLKTGEALKRWNKMSRSEKADVSAQTTQYDLMRSRDGRPRKRGNESMAQYLERLRAWEKWKIAEEQSLAAGDKQPDKNAIDQRYDEQYRADLEEWKRNNGIAEGADGPGAFPKREPNESPQDYALRVADYEQQADVWHDAPSWLDYQQRAQREYREAYEAWKSRYDLAEADNVDMELYEGRGNEGPKTDEDVEVEVRMEQALTQAVGVSLDGDGARRHAKLAVIERRKNLESSNAEDAIWLYQLKRKIEDTAKAISSRTGQEVSGEMLRHALPFIIEGTYFEEVLRDEDGNVVQIVDISDQLPIKKGPELDSLLDDIKDWYDEFYHVIEDAGLRNDAGYIPEGYVNHVWDKSKSNPSAWNKYIENLQRTKSPNMRHREIETYQQGIDVGLVPKYDDICDILAHYSRENNQAVANKKFLDDLSFLVVEETNEDGEVISALPLLDSKKPSFGEDSYAMYHVPGIGDVWVLKDVQKRFATIFGTMRTPDVSDWLSKLGRAYDLTGSTMKKIQLSFSGFHMGALTEVAMAQMRPDRAMKALGKYIIYDSFIKQGTVPAYAHPEDFQFAAKHLVQLGATQDYAASDVNAITDNFRKKMKEWYMEENAGKKIVGASATPLAFALDMANKGMDKVLWNYLHDGLKIACFKMFAEQIDERVRKENLSEQQREQLLDEAGQYVNDTFGGQYWELLNVSPGVLKWMRRAFLSPDWLISTQRHFFANFGFGSLYSESGFLNYLRFNADNIKRAFGADIPRDEMRRFRSRNAKICYLIGVICMYYPMMNAINAYFRSKDEDEEKAKADEIRKTNPDYKSPYELAYPDGMKWYDYTMLGNSLGQQTHLFWGRYEDGTETYVRWGKQFREFPELFMGRHGVEFPTPLIERMMGKANPMLGLTRDNLGALGVWGFTTSNDIKEIQRKYGKEIGVLAMNARHFLPFSIPTQAEKEFKLIDLVMPSQKGFTRYKTIDFFKTYILAGDMEGVTRTYNAAVMNGIDAEKCLKAAITTIKATQRKEMQDGVVDLQTAMEKFDAAGENGESLFSTKAALRNKIVAYLAENEYRAFTRADALEQIDDFLEGNGVAEKDSEKYIELCKSTDVRDDYRLSAIDRKAKEYVDKVKTCEDEGDRKKMAKQYAAWFAIKDISSKARSSINKLKKQLGQGRDEEVMNQIRDIRKKAQEAIDKVEAPK